MTRVYGNMFLGLGISAIMAALFAYMPEFRTLLYGTNADGKTTLSIIGWVILLAPLALVIVMGSVMENASSSTLKGLFVLFCSLMGASLSSIFLVYTEASILMCFIITGGMFGIMSFYGLVTKKDLSGWGSFLFMALIGVIIAMVANLFLRNSMLDFIVSCVAVVVFVGLTAYDTQKIKEELAYCSGEEEAKKIAIWGALSLYLDFVNLLLQILKLLGKKK